MKQSQIIQAPPDWALVKEETAKQILAQGETYLKSQMQFALDADKRAIALGASASAFSTASIAATLVAYNKEAPAAYLIAGVIAAAFSLFAACFFYYAARPVPFRIPGNHPQQWWKNADKPLNLLLGSETENVQAAIFANSKFLKSNSRHVKIGMSLFAAVPLLFLISFALASLFLLEGSLPASLSPWVLRPH